MQVADRSIEQLQSKYKELKKKAKHELSEAKRDKVVTGNRELRDSTIKTLRDSYELTDLRKRMGVSATGFTSRHCELIFFVEIHVFQEKSK